MSNLVEIKKRIESVSSTIKVTKVMQMIATAKIAKVKTKMASVEKYNNYADNILNLYLNNTKYGLDFDKYINCKNAEKNVLLVLFSSDKGTCGSINTNIFKETEQVVNNLTKEGYKVCILPIGKKALKFCTTNNEKYNFSLFESESFADAEYCDGEKVNSLVRKIIQMYNNFKFCEVHFIYHKFKNIITCTAIDERILPLSNDVIKNGDKDFFNIDEGETTQSSIVEFFIRTKLYNAYISNIASIISSRMNAMDNATKNGQEIIDELKIKYNKGRQASITSELSDIVSGFEAIS